MKSLTWLRVLRLPDGRYEVDCLWLDDGGEEHVVDGASVEDLPGVFRNLADDVEEAQQ